MSESVSELALAFLSESVSEVGVGVSFSVGVGVGVGVSVGIGVGVGVGVGVGLESSLSSLRMMPVLWLAAGSMVALVALLRVTLKVSFASNLLSPLTIAAIVFVSASGELKMRLPSLSS